MPTIRIEKTKNYTVMSNYHLKDKNLSLKTKGLLSIMLSLPDNWDYTETGLSKITNEGATSISTCLHQLEKFGYLQRTRERDEKGRMMGNTYVIYEQPCIDKTIADCPILENPALANPDSAKPKTAVPAQENAAQLNTKRQNKNTNKVNNESIFHSISNTSIQTDEWMDKKINSEKIAYDTCIKTLKENTGFELIKLKAQKLDEQLANDEISLDTYNSEYAENDFKLAEKIIEYLADIICGNSQKPFVINGNEINQEIIKSKLVKVTYAQLKFTVKTLNMNPNIKNPRNYAISILYNS